MIYSICSFHKNIGLPKRWLIYNDGTMKEHTISELNNLYNVEIVDLPESPSFIPVHILKKYKTLWKLEILMSLQIKRTILLSDSDIVYFNDFKKGGIDINRGNHFIDDEGNGYFDDSYKRLLLSHQSPLNSGFLILNTSYLDWSEVIEYIIYRDNENVLSYWSDQSAMDMFAIKNQFTPLPQNICIVGGNDSFKLSHCCN